MVLVILKENLIHKKYIAEIIFNRGLSVDSPRLRKCFSISSLNIRMY